MKKHIVIESADIGVGKTTLGKYLEENIINSELVEEKFSNDVLNTLYNSVDLIASCKIDKNSSSNLIPKCEKYMLLNREAQKLAVMLSAKDKIYIWDRSSISVLAFVHHFFKKEMITEADYKELKELYFSLAISFSSINTFLIHIEADRNILLERIRVRGRKSENRIDRDYITSIRETYNEIVWPHYEMNGIEKHWYNWNMYHSDNVLNDVNEWLSGLKDTTLI